MIRKQVFVREDQSRRRSQSALIREGIDRVLAEKEAAKAAGIWADRDDIDEIMAEARRWMGNGTSS